jgi:hypothetical protein
LWLGALFAPGHFFFRVGYAIIKQILALSGVYGEVRLQVWQCIPE